MQEVNGVSAYQYTFWFDEEGLLLFNFTNHAKGKILYQPLRRVTGTESILVVQTKSGLYLFLKSSLARKGLRSCLIF